MKIALLQFNPRIADLAKNCENIIQATKRATENKCDLLITSELSLCGYPPKDLLLREDFLKACEETLKKLALTALVPVIVGVPLRINNTRPYNAAVLCHNGTTKVVGRKRLLPNYNIFDEHRYFITPDNKACDTFEFLGKTFLMSICEDAWADYPKYDQLTYDFNPIKNTLSNNNKIDIIINISASPFSITKPKRREQVFCELAQFAKRPVLMCGQVGGNDQLLFDGHSMVINSQGQILHRARSAQNDFLIFDSSDVSPQPTVSTPHDLDLLKDVLVMGIRDYVKKTDNSGVIIGLSGGIDSALCAVLATEALGKEHVTCVFLPTRFSSTDSQRDAEDLATALGVRFSVINIESSVQGFRNLLGADNDIFDQNLQARTRGLIIMGLSNLSHELMLAPSNKSELSVGYSTIYGDMCGAFSPIGDLYKSQVKELAHHIQKQSSLFPPNILVKEPTAELREHQKDSDTLPPYDILDSILFRYIDEDKSPELIHHETGIHITLINQIVRMIGQSEYKRRQAPFSLMVSDKVFGEARRLPIAKKY